MALLRLARCLNGSAKETLHQYDFEVPGMTLATYTDLQAAIANYLARPGDTLGRHTGAEFHRSGREPDRLWVRCAVPIPAAPVSGPWRGPAVLITGAAQDAGTGGGTANAQTAAPAGDAHAGAGLHGQVHCGSEQYRCRDL